MRSQCLCGRRNGDKDDVSRRSVLAGFLLDESVAPSHLRQLRGFTDLTDLLYLFNRPL